MYPRMVQVEAELSHLLDADYSEEFSCISHQLDEQQDVHDKYEWSDKYVKENTIINQLWWDNDDVPFEDLEHQLHMKILTISTIRQPPGQVIPIHKDIFYQIKKRYDVEGQKIVRANIHLNDWDPGHMIQYQRKNDWHDWTKWKTNQGLMFDDTSLHIGMNGGTTDKYTLQLSGFLESSESH